MKVNNTQSQTVENKDSVILSPEDNQILSEVNLPFAQILSGKIGEYNINQAEDFSSLSIDFNYDSVSMGIEDALFFINLANEGNFSVQNASSGEFQSVIQTETAQNIVSQKTVEITNNLISLIEKSKNTQKPVRISFDNDVSVVIKIDKHGKITAEFIPGSIEVENYLKNNIASLKQRFDEQNLPYNDLLYRQNSKQNRNRNNKRGE